MSELIWIGKVRMGSGKGDEQVAGPISRNTAGARETEGRATRETFYLIRQQRRVGRDHHDDRASLFLVNGARNLFTHRNTRDCQLRSASAICLNKNADDIIVRRFIF